MNRVIKIAFSCLLLCLTLTSWGQKLTVKFSSPLTENVGDTSFTARLYFQNHFAYGSDIQEVTSRDGQTFVFEIDQKYDVVATFECKFGKINERFEVYLQPGKSLNIEINTQMVQEANNIYERDKKFYEDCYTYTGNLAAFNFRLYQYTTQIRPLYWGNNSYPSSWERMHDSLVFEIQENFEQRLAKKYNEVLKMCDSMGEEKEFFYEYVCDQVLLHFGVARIQHFSWVNNRHRMDSGAYYEVVNMFCALNTGNYRLSQFRVFAMHLDLYEHYETPSDSLFLVALEQEPLIDELKVFMIVERYKWSFISKMRLVYQKSRRATYDPASSDRIFREALERNGSEYAQFMLKHNILDQIKEQQIKLHRLKPDGTR